MAKLHIYLILTPIAALLWLTFLQQHWQFPLSHTRHQISNSSHDDVGPTDITLTLKTIYHHASPSGPYPGLFRRLDMPPATLLSTLDRYHLRPAAAVGQAYPITTKAGRHYLYDVYRYNGARRRLRAGVVNTFIQETTQVPLLLPDVTHRPSVLQLAMMTNNAYSEVDNNSTDWYDLGDPWKLVNFWPTIKRNISPKSIQRIRRLAGNPTVYEAMCLVTKTTPFLSSVSREQARDSGAAVLRAKKTS